VCRAPIIPSLRDYREWLAESERPPVHLLRLLPDEELHSSPAEPERSSQQTGDLFDEKQRVAGGG
jgi:hypothetical protein